MYIFFRETDVPTTTAIMALMELRTSILRWITKSMQMRITAIEVIKKSWYMDKP